MIRFECDYAEGCAQPILDALIRTNFEQTCGYGLDPHCMNAIELIKKECGKSDVDVHFVVGGTQANTIVIAQILRPHQGVVAVESGHINVHESGAIEACGHKVIALPGVEGKLTAGRLKAYLMNFWADDAHEHMVEPAMVYISHPTEVGTVYGKKELQDIYAVCREYQIPLFIDGARLGYGLMSDASDLTLQEIVGLCDVFYIGGTKVGAMFGEAIVFTRPELNLSRNFRSVIKQKGAMLAKGRLLGVQYEALFTDGLYWKLSENAIVQARKIRDAFVKKGFKMGFDSPTNQLFPILPKEIISRLSEDFAFMIWPDNGEPELLTRFCTSWATKDEEAETLVKAIEAL